MAHGKFKYRKIHTMLYLLLVASPICSGPYGSNRYLLPEQYGYFSQTYDIHMDPRIPAMESTTNVNSTQKRMSLWGLRAK